MIYLNYVMCALLVACLILEAVFIVRRNRTIIVKGKDDFFTITLIVLFIFLLFPFSDSITMIESLRNVLMYVVVFASAAIKRGLSGSGVEKLGFTIDWQDVKEIRINAYQASKVQAVFLTDKRKYKLLFSKYMLKDVLREMEKHVHINHIYIQSSLDDVLKMKKAV